MIRCSKFGLGAVWVGLLLLSGTGWLWGQSAPTNDMFGRASIIPAAISNMVRGSNIGATHESGEPFHAGQSSTPHTVWWSWTAPVTGSYAVSTVGSDFDTVLAVYLGASLTNLTSLGAADDDAGGNGAELFIFRAIVGETFHIVVDGSFGAVGNIILSIQPGGQAIGPWEAKALAGGQIGSAELTNKVVLVDFWETTCGACVDEIPQLIQLQNALTNQGFTMLGLYENSGSPSNVTAFKLQMGMNYPLAAGTPELDAWLGTQQGYPRKYLIDREGRVVAQYYAGSSFSSYLALVTPFLRQPAKVRLQVTRQTTGQIEIAWPGPDSAFKVDVISNLASNRWTLFTTNAQLRAGTNVVVAYPNTNWQYFRLRK